MQFRPNTCPQSSRTGTSGFSPRRKISVQIVQVMSLPREEATGRRALERNSLSRTAVRALMCSFWASG